MGENCFVYLVNNQTLLNSYAVFTLGPKAIHHHYNPEKNLKKCMKGGWENPGVFNLKDCDSNQAHSTI